MVAALAIGLMVADRFLPGPAPQASTVTTATADPAVPEASAVRDASIAVLPFADLSPDGDQEYFSDGMAEEILNALVGVDGLQVASRTSSFGFKGQESLGMPVIADRLGVRHVLEGSVRRAGDTLRITAQLIDARVDRHLWSETYDRPLTAENVFAIQEEIATAIVAALADSLGARVHRESPLAQPTANLTAYDLYLQALSRFQGRTALDEADDLLGQALEQDPEFAAAWELRAAIQPLKRSYGYSDLSQDELEARGMEYAQQALALQPDSAMALASMAHMRSMATAGLRQQHELPGIIADLERAVGIDPANSSALNWLGLALGHVGRMEDALAVFRKCMERDPLFAPCAENEYEVLWVLGRPHEAWASFRRSISQSIVTREYVNFGLLAHLGQKEMFMWAANQSVWLPACRRQDEVYEAYRNPMPITPPSWRTSWTSWKSGRGSPTSTSRTC